MNKLYKYMRETRDKMYEEKRYEVTMDQAHFFQLYKLVCDMLQVRCIIKQYDDPEEKQ